MGFESRCPVVRTVKDRKQTFYHPGVVAMLCSCTPQQTVISVVVQIWCERINVDLNVGFYSVLMRFRSFSTRFPFSFPSSLTMLPLFFIFLFPFHSFDFCFVSFYFNFLTGFYYENIFRNGMFVFDPATEPVPGTVC